MRGASESLRKGVIKNIELELNNLIKVSKEFKELKKNLNTFGRGDASKLIFKETLNFLNEKN